MSVSAFAGTSFRFMPSVDVEFLKENPSNNLYISKLFILSLSLVEADARARQDIRFSQTDKTGADYFLHSSTPLNLPVPVYTLLYIRPPESRKKEAMPYGGIRHGNQPCPYAAVPFRVTLS